MSKSRGTSRSNFGTRTHPARELTRGVILTSKTGSTTVEVKGFGFMGHSFRVTQCHPLSPFSVGDKGWTGQDWKQGWEVSNG